MGRPPLFEATRKTTFKHDAKLLERIRAWADERGIRDTGEAIRQLIERGLKE